MANGIFTKYLTENPNSGFCPHKYRYNLFSIKQAWLGGIGIPKEFDSRGELKAVLGDCF